MVESFKEKLAFILQQLETKFGSVDLFAVLKMDEVTEKWSIIVAARWVEGAKRQAAFNEIIELMRMQLEQEERSSIARLGVLNTSDHLAKLMIDEFKDGETITGDRKVNGNIIHFGYILKARETSDANQQKLV